MTILQNGDNIVITGKPIDITQNEVFAVDIVLAMPPKLNLKVAAFNLLGYDMYVNDFKITDDSIVISPDDIIGIAPSECQCDMYTLWERGCQCGAHEREDRVFNT
jgi:hypothetical protein